MFRNVSRSGLTATLRLTYRCKTQETCHIEAQACESTSGFSVWWCELGPNKGLASVRPQVIGSPTSRLRTLQHFHKGYVLHTFHPLVCVGVSRSCLRQTIVLICLSQECLHSEAYGKATAELSTIHPVQASECPYVSLFLLGLLRALGWHSWQAFKLCPAGNMISHTLLMRARLTSQTDSRFPPNSHAAVIRCR